MFPQDSLPKLKDLALLKGQLESLQRRVEDEAHAGVGQVRRAGPGSAPLCPALPAPRPDALCPRRAARCWPPPS